MMRRLGKILDKDWPAWLISSVFHPVFIPFYTVLLYFYLSSYFFYNFPRLLKIIFLPAVVVPLLLQFLLWRMHILKSFFLITSQARLYFTLLMAFIYLLLFRLIQPLPVLKELSVFFLGVSISLFLAAFFNLFRLRPSLHALAFAGGFLFLLLHSYRHRENILDILALWIFTATLTIAARFKLNAHTPAEIFLGLLSGFAGIGLAYLYLY